jgi:hypothetical protein
MSRARVGGEIDLLNAAIVDESTSLRLLLEVRSFQDAGYIRDI